MLKNKDDSFLGDQITNNIKYADNAWQALGTVDRTSMYLSEPILDLIYKNTEYDKESGMYKYLPRASVSILGENYSGAKLSHDLILVNNLLYSSTPTNSYNNIYNLNDYIKYALVVTNPIYSTISKDKKIYLINKELVKSNKCDLAKMNFQSFVRIFNPMSFLKKDLIDWSTNSDAFNENILINFLWNKYTKDNSSLSKLATFKELFNSDEFDVDSFIEDFSLTLHDPLSVKLPYYSRKVSDEVSDNEKFKYFTRLFPNLSCIDDTINVGYVEKISDIAEDYYNQKNTTFEGGVLDFVEIDTVSSESLQNITSGNLSDINKDEFDILNDNYEQDAKNCYKSLSSISNIMSSKGFSSLFPKLYLGYNSNVNFISSDGIHLLQEENKSAIFKDEDDENFSIYNNVILGYRLVDNLISQRTFIGSIFNLIYVTQTSNVSINLKSVDLNKISSKKQLLDVAPNFIQLTNNYQGYCTIDMLAVLYSLSNQLTKVEKPFSTYINNLTSSGYFLEDFSGITKPIYDWLSNETFLFKTPIYGDYVESLNFMQDLNPDSKPNFSGLHIKNTDLVYKRFQDSKYEIPYLENTTPLINLSNNEKLYNSHNSDSFNGVGLIKSDKGTKKGELTQNTVPPNIYDYDKGDEEDKFGSVDKRTKEGGLYNQRVNSSNGNLEIDGRIKSRTIDEIWTFLKYLSESTGALNSENDIPSFYGLLADAIGYDFTDTVQKENIRLNQKSEKYGQDKQELDILQWHPNSNSDYKPYYSSEIKPELNFGGFIVDKAIPKVLDYKVNIFGRSEKTDGSVYEYNTESGKYHDTTGYLTQLFNNFEIGLYTKSLGNEKDLDNILSLDSFNTSIQFVDSDIIKDSDKYYQISNNRKKAMNRVSSILNWHDGNELHNHYKEYLEHPKNLKTIERDLETLRQNLQTLTEYSVSNFVVKGFSDRSTNVGTLHILHRNSFDFKDTFLKNDSDSLNNEKDTLVVEELDKKVVFEDGQFDQRYLHDNYDSGSVDLSDPITNTRSSVDKSKIINKTYLSEVYLAADGTWRSVHEHLLAPIIDDEY